MAKKQQQAGVKERVQNATPKFYKVILHNDDETTMDFVIELLETVFLKSPEEAEKLMLEVHTHGSAVVGIYPFDIAASKVLIATDMARKAGFPLRITYSEE